MAFLKSADNRPVFFFNHIEGVPRFAQWEPIKVIFDPSLKELIFTDKKVDRVSRLRFDLWQNIRPYCKSRSPMASSYL